MLKMRHKGQATVQETWVILWATHKAMAGLEFGTAISEDFRSLLSGTEFPEDTQGSKLH